MATLSANEILQDTLDAIKIKLPMLRAMSTDFSSATAKKGDTITAHIRTLPSVQDYDANTGFKANAAEASSLLTDVPVTLDRFKHVNVKVDYIDHISSRKNLYQSAVADLGYVLAKDMIDYVLGLMNDSNATYEEVESIANTQLETLEKVRTKLNTNGAGDNRFGIVNSAFAQALGNDSRVASRDYYGQLNGASGYRTFNAVAGFQSVWEYPSLPSNSVNLSGVFGDPRAFILASRVPDVGTAAAAAGIPQIANFATQTDAETGLTLLGISWQEAGTFDAYFTVTALYGAKCGAQAGGAGAILDKALCKVVTA